MAVAAQPTYRQGLAVIIVMHFAIRAPAVFARTLRYLAAALRNTGLAASVISETLIRVERM